MCRCWRGAEGAARCCAKSTQEEVQRGWPGRLERPAVPHEPGAHQRVPRTAPSSKTQPGERTWLVQTVSEPLRSKGRAHAQEVPVEKPERERVVPGAAQVQAYPPSIAARGCRGREKPADSEAGLAKPAEPPDRLRRSPAHKYLQRDPGIRGPAGSRDHHGLLLQGGPRERLPADGPAMDNLSSSRGQPGNSRRLLEDASVSR